MAAFDDALNQQNPQIPVPIPDPNRMAFLQGQFQYLFAEVTNLRGMVNNPPPPPLLHLLHSVPIVTSHNPLTSLELLVSSLPSNSNFFSF